jgi:hypothetical protein
MEDGALALDRHELWEEPQKTSRFAMSQSHKPPPRLQAAEWFVTVPGMAPPRPSGTVRRARRRQRRVDHRVRRFTLLAVVTSIVVVTLSLTAFGTGSTTPVRAAGPAPAQRLVPTGPPAPQIVASQGALRIQLPISQARVTAIGFHAPGSGALALDPLGHQGNEGLFSRFAHKLFGGHHGGLTWYQLTGGSGASTGALDVGATPGTDAYSPVDGVIVALTDYVIDGRVYGRRIDIQPANAPSVVVSVTRLEPDAALSVGSAVVAGASRLGTVLDLSKVEKQALAHYTQDAGNHVTIEVHPAATLALP